MSSTSSRWKYGSMNYNNGDPNCCSVCCALHKSSTSTLFLLFTNPMRCIFTPTAVLHTQLYQMMSASLKSPSCKHRNVQKWVSSFLTVSELVSESRSIEGIYAHHSWGIEFNLNIFMNGKINKIFHSWSYMIFHSSILLRFLSEALCLK